MAKRIYVNCGPVREEVYRRVQVHLAERASGQFYEYGQVAGSLNGAVEKPTRGD